MKKPIYEKIFEIMKAKGMTQKEFSKQTGIPESTISDWKHKKFNPGSDKIPAICKVLGIEPAELLDADEAGDIDFRYYLSEDESILIERFRSIDAEDKSHILSYSKFLSEFNK